MGFRRLLSAGLAVAAVAAVVGCGAAKTSSSPLSFFITSANPGKGGDLGGLAGADRYCQSLASSVGAGGKTWRAYLSTAALNGQPAVNARDRIGNGPWRNAKGVVVANNLTELHSANNNLGKQTSLTEKGELVSGRGDPVNTHDILTGSRADGTVAVSPTGGATCGNWTLSEGGSAFVGHHDKTGTNPDPVANVSWNASHGSRGCSAEQLKASGGAGLFYCFAVN